MIRRGVLGKSPWGVSVSARQNWDRSQRRPLSAQADRQSFPCPARTPCAGVCAGASGRARAGRRRGVGGWGSPGGSCLEGPGGADGEPRGQELTPAPATGVNGLASGRAAAPAGALNEGPGGGGPRLSARMKMAADTGSASTDAPKAVPRGDGKIAAVGER